MKRFMPIVLALVLSSCVSSHRTIFLKAPPADQRDSVDVAAYETKYGKYDGVYLDVDESIEHSGTSERMGFGATSWNYNHVSHRKYIVLNPDVQYLTTFSLTTYRDAKIGTFYLQVTAPGGTVTRYGLKDLVQETASKSVVKYKFIYPNVVKGSIIEEGFELGYDGFRNWDLDQDVPLQFRIPCERVAYTYAFPDWWEIRVKKISPVDTIPYTLTRDPDNRKVVISCTVLNVPAVKDEPYDPYFKEVARYLEFMVSSFEMGGIAYQAPKSWSELIERSEKRLTEREGGGLFSSRVENTTTDLIKGKTGDLEKLTTILDYVQTNIEIADDTEDRDFADVLKDKKGNGYVMTGLTNMMMKKAGLSSNFIMVHSAKQGYFDPDYYSYDQLSIPAIDARVDGKEYVLLPYRKDFPYDYIPEYLQGQRYLVVSDDPHATLATVPSGSQTKNSVVERFNLVIGPDGLITVDETKTIQGWYAYFMREMVSNMNQTQKDKFIKELISYSEGEVNIATHTLENEKVYKNPLVLHYSYSINNLVTLTPEEALFHTAGLFAPTSLKDFRVESEERSGPIRIYENDEYVKEIEVRYPSSWELKSALHPLEIENMFGSLKVQVENTDHVLKVKQRRLLTRNSQPKEKIGELAKLAGSKTSTVLPTVVFAKKP